jgi:hypothetical protein
MRQGTQLGARVMMGCAASRTAWAAAPAARDEEKVRFPSANTGCATAPIGSASDPTALSTQPKSIAGAARGVPSCHLAIARPLADYVGQASVLVILAVVSTGEDAVAGRHERVTEITEGAQSSQSGMLCELCVDSVSSVSLLLWARRFPSRIEARSR